MLEQEVLGELTLDQYNHYFNIFTQKFGQPQKQTRLSISFWDKQKNEIDTRIRITNGQAEIMQKVGQWEGENQLLRTETSLILPSDADQILAAFKILDNVAGDNRSYHYSRHENYIFNCQIDIQGQTHQVEIKLCHQFGQTDKYEFEVEVSGDQTDLQAVLDQLNLTNLVLVTDEAFWDKWNDQLNNRYQHMSDQQIKQLIQQYL